MIYLDNCATTPMAQDVLEAMMPYFTQYFGNASSSTHPFGWQAAEAVKISREKIADYFKVSPQEIYFTSGATEGINWVLKGIFEKYKSKGNHIISTKIEHKAVLDTLSVLEQRGAEISYIGVNSDGVVNVEELEQAIRPDTLLVSVMWANNETGVIQPVEEIARICKQAGTLFFSDATQAVAKMNTSLGLISPDIITFSGHKIYGPKGIGAVIIRNRRPAIRLNPLIDGGGQENAMRGGTLNVPGIVGLARCIDRIHPEYFTKWIKLRDFFEVKIKAECRGVMIQGENVRRLPSVSHLIFPGIDAGRLIAKLSNRIALSSGSACSSGSHDPSHVLVAMKVPAQYLKSAIRICLGEMTTKEDLETLVESIVKVRELL